MKTPKLPHTARHAAQLSATAGAFVRRRFPVPHGHCTLSFVSIALGGAHTLCQARWPDEPAFNPPHATTAGRAFAGCARRVNREGESSCRGREQVVAIGPSGLRSRRSMAFTCSRRLVDLRTGFTTTCAYSRFKLLKSNVFRWSAPAVEPPRPNVVACSSLRATGSWAWGEGLCC